MIVVPLNEVARNDRRTPWVTLALVAACVAGFLYTGPSDQAADEQVDLQVEAAWEYFQAHPYVKPSPALAAMFGEDEVAHLAAAFRSELRRSGSPAIPDFVVAHDQLEFERITERIDLAMASHSFHRFGFRPEALRTPDHTLFSYVLVHEGWLHLLSNLALLVAAALLLEEVWGRGLFALFLAGGAAAAAAGYALLDPEGGVLGGASGLAAAAAGAFLVRFAWTPIRFRYFYIPPFGGTFTARGWITLPIYGALYAVLDYFLAHGMPGIAPPETELATSAHLGGLAFGAVFALVMRVSRVEELFIHPKIERKLTSRSNPVLDRALEAREKGRLEEAVEILAGEVVRHPQDHDACLAYWDAATAVGRPEQAADAVLRVLRDEIARGKRDLVIQHWRELNQRAPNRRLDAPHEGKVARLLIQAGEHDLATFAIRRVLAGECGPASPPVLHRLARAAQEIDKGLALEVAQRALADPEVEPADRAELDKLVGQLASTSRGNDTKGGASARPSPEDSHPLFDRRNHDLGASADRGVRGATPARPGVDEESDTLNAPPFELDDLEAPAGGQELDLAPDPAAYEPGHVLPGEETLPPLAEPDDLDALDDLSLDDEGPPALDYNRTIDLADLGARTLPALEVEPSGGAGAASDPDNERTLDLEALGARTLRPGEASFDDHLRTVADPDALTVPDYGNTLEPAALQEETTGQPGDGPELVPLEREPSRRAAQTAPPWPRDLADADPEVDLTPEPEVDLEPEGAREARAAAAPAALEADALDLGALPEAPARRPLRRMNAIPLALGERSVTLDVGERGKAELELTRIEAVAVVGVKGLRPKPVVLVDLISNWMAPGDEPLKVIRLRSDRFDPRKLVPGESAGFQALKTWIGQLVARSGAVPLPDASAVAGEPFRTFESLEDYEREVLRAG